MKIRSDLFRVRRDLVDEKGDKLEPEQQAVEHVFQGTAPLGVSTPGVLAQGTHGSMPLEIVARASAAEVARSISATCGQCRHFNRTAWLKMLSNATNPGATPGEKHSVDLIKAEIIMRMPEPDQHTGGDLEYDVEHALKAMGMCFPLREYYTAKDGKDPGIMGVWPSSSCPLEICTPDKPFGLFIAKDLDAEKIGAKDKDTLMFAAAGKT